jgi:hypothetical protein
LKAAGAVNPAVNTPKHTKLSISSDVHFFYAFCPTSGRRKSLTSPPRTGFLHDFTVREPQRK